VLCCRHLPCVCCTVLCCCQGWSGALHALTRTAPGSTRHTARHHMPTVSNSSSGSSQTVSVDLAPSRAAWHELAGRCCSRQCTLNTLNTSEHSRMQCAYTFWDGTCANGPRACIMKPDDSHKQQRLHPSLHPVAASRGSGAVFATAVRRCITISAYTPCPPVFSAWSHHSAPPPASHDQVCGHPPGARHA